MALSPLHHPTVEFEVPKSIPQAFATLFPLKQKGRIICHAAQNVLRLLKGRKPTVVSRAA
jgi:hypothetical protein